MNIDVKPVTFNFIDCNECLPELNEIVWGLYDSQTFGKNIILVTFDADWWITVDNKFTKKYSRSTITHWAPCVKLPTASQPSIQLRIKP